MENTGKLWNPAGIANLIHTQLLEETLNVCIPDFVDRMIDAWKESVGNEINLSSHFSAILLDNIGTVPFLHDFDRWSQWSNAPMMIITKWNLRIH